MHANAIDCFGLLYEFYKLRPLKNFLDTVLDVLSHHLCVTNQSNHCLWLQGFVWVGVSFKIWVEYKHCLKINHFLIKIFGITLLLYSFYSFNAVRGRGRRSRCGQDNACEIISHIYFNHRISHIIITVLSLKLYWHARSNYFVHGIYFYFCPKHNTASLIKSEVKCLTISYKILFNHING